MLQTGGLIHDLSVRELIAMVASLYPRPLDIDQVLEQTGLDGIAERRTQKLSGGETQRLRFALALVSDPALLVLDEPTVAMDVEARHAFWLVMRRVAAEGKTIVFATHYLEEADANADRVLLMARGRIVADGSPAEIKAMTGVRTIRATVATPPTRRWPASPASPASSGTATGWCSPAPTPTSRSARCSSGSRTSARSRSAAPTSSRPSCS